MKIKVLVLKGCDVCKNFIGALNEANLEYTTIDADENDTLADYVESLTGTNTYPMVILEKSTQTAYLYRADDANKLGSSIVGSNEMIIGCFSADTMFENIISLLN
jgi:glutaredoxin